VRGWSRTPLTRHSPKAPGTIGLELLPSRRRFDSILVPLGDGALLAGVPGGEAHESATRMVGVCSAARPRWSAPGGRAGSELERAETIADGIAVQTPSPRRSPTFWARG